MWKWQKDLEVHVDRSFKPSRHCVLAARKARVALSLIVLTFTYPIPKILVPLYCSLVHSHLEYVIQATCPYLTKDVNYVEKVQYLTARKVKGIKDLPYTELCRLKSICL